MQGVRAKVVHEAQQFFAIAAFLAVFFGAFSIYRSLVLREYGLLAFRFGAGFITALVVAKVVLIGKMARLGERHADKALIVPVLYKTAVYGVLVVAFVVVEHVIEGLVHGERALGHILGLGWDEILARTVVLMVGLLPLCAILEMDRVLGEGTLFNLFFRRQSGGVQSELVRRGP